MENKITKKSKEEFVKNVQRLIDLAPYQNRKERRHLVKFLNLPVQIKGDMIPYVNIEKKPKYKLPEFLND